jgi:hypothetical protein
MSQANDRSANGKWIWLELLHRYKPDILYGTGHFGVSCQINFKTAAGKDLEIRLTDGGPREPGYQGVRYRIEPEGIRIQTRGKPECRGDSENVLSSEGVLLESGMTEELMQYLRVRSLRRPGFTHSEMTLTLACAEGMRDDLLKVMPKRPNMDNQTAYPVVAQ